MKFIKAIAIGLASVTVVALATTAPVIWLMFKYPANEGYFVVTHWHLWPTVGIFALVFSTTFLWRCRHSR